MTKFRLRIQPSDCIYVDIYEAMCLRFGSILNGVKEAKGTAKFKKYHP